jgi:DNA end-binding protein Ku
MAVEVKEKQPSDVETEQLATGCEAIAEAIRLADVDVMAAYPIRPYDGVLALSTMLFEDEVVPKSEIEDLHISGGKPTDREIRMASQIIESLTTDWKPARYRDTYREKVLELVNKKAKGEEIVVDEEDAAPQKVVDLMAALEASLEAAKKPTKSATKKRAAAREKAAPKKAAAKKTTAKKTAAGKRKAA